MRTKNICCIFNLAPHYNEPIYRLMDSELICDFYIGDRVAYPIKLMDYSILKGFKHKLNYIPIIKNFYWQKGSVKLAFKGYNKYIITGDPYCLSTWLLLIFSFILRKKCYLWTHGWYGDESEVKKIIKKMFFWLCDTVLLYGNYAKKLMIKEGFDHSKLIVIYNSMDFEAQFEISKNLKNSGIFTDFFKNNYPVLLYVGRIQSRKKIELLINALNILKKRNNHFNLVIIGGQSDELDLEVVVKSHNLENHVWFYGVCYDEKKIGEIIYNSDLCVVPGDVGLTVMHSFIYGTPVLTHDNFSCHGPEFEAIQPGKTGDFYINGSVEDLCNKIIDWTINRSISREIIRNNCMEIIQNKYNPQVQIQILNKTILK